MAFVKIEDHLTSREIVVFPKTYALHKAHLEVGRLVVVLGKVSEREGQPTSVLADSIACFDETDLDQVVNMLKDGMWVDQITHEDVVERRRTETPKTRSIVIHLAGAPTDKQITSLRGLFQEKPGTVPVQFSVEAGGGQKLIRTEYTITPTKAVLDTIRDIIGEGTVKVVEPMEMG